MKRVSLSLADAVAHSFEMSDEHTGVNDSARIRLMVQFQNNIDYEELSSLLIKRKKSDLLFAFIARHDLRKRNRKRAVI